MIRASSNINLWSAGIWYVWTVKYISKNKKKRKEIKLLIDRKRNIKGEAKTKPYSAANTKRISPEIDFTVSGYMSQSESIQTKYDQ